MRPSISGPWIVYATGDQPRTLEDVIYTKRIGPLEKHYHCVPRERDYHPWFPRYYSILHATQLYDERRRIAGRPLKLSLREATEDFEAYWISGMLNQTEIAKKRGLTLLSVHRMINRLSYWFV